jgi:ABC-type anion transport system duplicated permease subunit
MEIDVWTAVGIIGFFVVVVIGFILYSMGYRGSAGD